MRFIVDASFLTIHDSDASTQRISFRPIIDTTARLARGGVGRDRSEPPGACSAHRRARPVGTSADTLLGVSATSLFASHAPRAMAVSDHSGAAASANRSSPNDSFPPNLTLAERALVTCIGKNPDF